MVGLDEAHHQQAAALAPTRQGLHRALRDPRRRVVRLVQIGPERAECVPVDAGCFLTILATLVDQIEPVDQALVAKPAVVVIVKATGAVLFGQEHLLEADVQVGGREVHLAHGLGAVSGVPQHAGEGGDARRERAAVGPAQVLVDVLAAQQRVARRGAYRERAEAVLVAHAVGCQRVDVGCAHVGIAVRSQAVEAVLVGVDEQNVGGFLFGHMPHQSLVSCFLFLVG